MKGYIIHLPKSQKSLDSALSIKLELESIGIEPHLFNGCDRYDVWQEFIDNEFTIQDITRFGGGYVDSEIATFISHYKLWKKCVDDNESIIIFEHDANIDLTFDINLKEERFVTNITTYTITEKGVNVIELGYSELMHIYLL